MTTINDVMFNGTVWKPLNKGLILSTLTICDVTQILLNAKYDFVLTHRFTQDALENIFSQVRRRIGNLPNATNCLKVMRIICVSQFVSDIKRTNYCNDSDRLLIDHCKTLSSTATEDTKKRLQLDHNYYAHPVSEAFSTVSVEESSKFLDLYTLNLVYYIGGSIVNALRKNCCDDCLLLLSQGSEKIGRELEIVQKFFEYG